MMKEKIVSLFYACAILFILTLLVSLFLAGLYMTNWINELFMQVIYKISGWLLYALAGFILGRKIKKHTFWIALGISGSLGLILFFTLDKTLINITFLTIKVFTFAFVAALTRKKTD